MCLAEPMIEQTSAQKQLNIRIGAYESTKLSIDLTGSLDRKRLVPIGNVCYPIAADRQLAKFRLGHLGLVASTY